MKAQELQGETQQKEFSELLEKINANSKDGLREFYEKYGKLIACTAAIFFKNQFLVDEIVNEVLIKIWKKSKYDCKIDNPKGWIYVITANCAKSLLRKRRFLSLKESMVDSKDGIQEFIDRDSFYFMLKDLSEIEKQIIIHRCVSKFTFEEIAEILGKRTSTISSMFYRAMDKIKEKIEKS